MGSNGVPMEEVIGQAMGKAKCHQNPHYLNNDCKTFSSVSAAGSPSFLRPFSSNRGGSSTVETVSESGDSARRCRLRSGPEPWDPFDRSSAWRRLWWLLSRSESRLSSSELLSSLWLPCRSRSWGLGEGLGEITCSCGRRSNLTSFSCVLTALGASAGDVSGLLFRPGTQSVKWAKAWVG